MDETPTTQSESTTAAGSPIKQISPKNQFQSISTTEMTTESNPFVSSNTKKEMIVSSTDFPAPELSDCSIGYEELQQNFEQVEKENEGLRIKNEETGRALRKVKEEKDKLNFEVVNLRRVVHDYTNRLLHVKGKINELAYYVNSPQYMTLPIAISSKISPPQLNHQLHSNKKKKSSRSSSRHGPPPPLQVPTSSTTPGAGGFNPFAFTTIKDPRFHPRGAGHAQSQAMEFRGHNGNVVPASNVFVNRFGMPHGVIMPDPVRETNIQIEQCRKILTHAQHQQQPSKQKQYSKLSTKKPKLSPSAKIPSSRNPLAFRNRIKSPLISNPNRSQSLSANNHIAKNNTTTKNLAIPSQMLLRSPVKNIKTKGQRLIESQSPTIPKKSPSPHQQHNLGSQKAIKPLNLEMNENVSYYCGQVMEKLLKHEDAAIFKKAVSKREYPEYYAQIEEPMWLNRVKNKLSNGIYKNVEEFHVDLKLIWKNAQEFNPEGHFISELAKEMEVFSEKQMFRYQLIEKVNLKRKRNENLERGDEKKLKNDA